MSSTHDDDRGPLEAPDADLEAAAAGASRLGPCPGDALLLEFQRGALGATEEETLRDHLASCADCAARARDARDFVETVHPAGGRAPSRRRAAWIGLAAALAGLAILGLWSLRRGAGPAPDVPGVPIAWSDLAVAPAPYQAPAPPAGADRDLVFRDGDARDPFAAAMERYAAGDFAAAETALEALVAARGADRRARFYLAVTRLINGRAEDARRELESLERSGAAPDDAEVSWYLALALVKTGRLDDARDRLDALLADGGPRAAEAGALLSRLDGGAGR